MQNLRHISLQIRVNYQIEKLESWGHDGKLEMLVKKIKVNFFYLYLHFRGIESYNIFIYTMK